jgi:hypothetical protein
LGKDRETIRLESCEGSQGTTGNRVQQDDTEQGWTDLKYNKDVAEYWSTGHVIRGMGLDVYQIRVGGFQGLNNLVLCTPIIKSHLWACLLRTVVRCLYSED